MGNEGQQPPMPQQGSPGQPDYYGWQYDQEHPDAMVQQPSVEPQPSMYPPPQQSPAPPPQPYRGQGQQQVPSRYQQPVADMGSSLGYGQGMEYQYFEAPQPSQPLPMLRQARYQQLREERMRRQQRRMKPDVTSMISGKDLKQPPESAIAPSAQPAQFSPVLSPPPKVSPIVQRSPSRRSISADEQLQAVAEAAQDTGIIQRSHIRRATLILTGAFVASRVLGLLRSSMFAFVFGTGVTSDAYLQAFLIPDLIFNIVAGGALSSAFIPVFTTYMIGKKDEKSAWHIASSALNLALAIMLVLALIAIIFAPQLVPLYNPKAASTSPADYIVHINLITSLTRIMLLQSIVLGGGVVVNSILYARQKFLLPAVGTVLYNVGLIAGLAPGFLLAFHGQRNDITAVYAATWGVVIGAILQVGIQIPGLVRVGMHYTPSFDWRHPGVIQVGRQMVPRIINAAVLYVSIFVDRYLISFLGVVVTDAVLSGLITQYYYALQLMLLPLGIFGMAVSTAAFPTLAENVARGRFDRVHNIILETLRSILFLSIPSSIGLIVLGLPILQVLLEHGRFTLDEAQSTAFPLAGFAVGLAGLASVEILTRSFYALRDSLTPVIVSIGQFIFKIALSLILIDAAVWGPQWGTGALALSTSIAGLIEAAVLLWLLHQRIGDLQLRQLGIFIGRILLASLAMGLGLLVTRFLLDLILVTTRDQSLGFGGTFLALVKLLLEIFVGVVIYIKAARRLGIEEMGPVKRLLDRFKLSWI